MVRYLTNGTIDPSVTPDPVFAFNQNIKEQYTREELLSRFNINGNYLLVSFSNTKTVSSEWIRSFGLLAKQKGFECIGLTMPGGITFRESFSKVIEVPLSPKEWYGLIKFSSGYVGELMHAMVVALHNSVPFFAFDIYGIIRLKYFVIDKSSKIYDILSKAGFLDYRVSALGRGYKSPAPEFVLSKIINFNLEKCNRFSIRHQILYNSMMDNIIKLFSK